MAESLNLSFALIPPRDGKWVPYNETTNSWNGAVKDLIDEVADLSPSIFYLTQVRWKVVDFSLPIISTEMIFLVSSEPSYSFDIFLRPFHSFTWIFLYIAMFLFILACLLALVTRMGKEEQIEEFDFLKSIIFVYGACLRIEE